ncbi:PTS system mannose-specific transporter subunit IIC [Streptococcus pneumoniae]|nr:PTS system mannose-specific transporter subunit IIC [Streptococcus pneumoniae]
MSIISMVLVVVVAFFAGLEGILDQFQFHQPLVACTLIGLVTGHLEAGIILGGSLQMIALGWSNIGAAIAPDAALASVAAAIIMVLGGDFTKTGIGVAQAVAIPLAVAGLFLTMIVRTISVGLVHTADAAAKKGDFGAWSVRISLRYFSRDFVSRFLQLFSLWYQLKLYKVSLVPCQTGSKMVWLSVVVWSLPLVTPWLST